MSIRDALLVAVAVVALGVEPAQTQETGSMQVGNVTVAIGGGTALLTLPEIEFAKIRTGNVVTSRLKSSDDFGDEIGWNIDGAITMPTVGMNGRRKWISLSGFWANIDDDDTVQCTSPAGAGQPRCAFNSIVDDPALADNIAFGGGTIGDIATKRDVDHWGVSLESKWDITRDVMGVTRAPNRRYLALGADIRRIDQDIALRANITNTTPSIFIASLNEDLDTRYYGAYSAWGGDFSPFLLKGLWSRWGLQSSFNLRGGIYYTDTDYDGVSQLGAFNTPRQLSLSESDVAFIGGLVLETRKQIGSRAALSLKSEYEYYSWVPEMRYNDVDANVGISGPNVGTSIGDEDAFSARTSLRLVVGLGPRELYQDPGHQ